MFIFSVGSQVYRKAAPVVDALNPDIIGKFNIGVGIHSENNVVSAGSRGTAIFVDSDATVEIDLAAVGTCISTGPAGKSGLITAI